MLLAGLVGFRVRFQLAQHPDQRHRLVRAGRLAGPWPPDLALVPLFVRTNVLKYLPGGIWHLMDRVRVLRPSMGTGSALAAVLLDPLLIVAAAFLLLLPGGWQNGLVLLAPLPAVLMVRRWREPLLQSLERSKAAQLEQVGVALLPDADPGSRRHGYPWRPLAWQLIFVTCRFAGLFCCVQAFRLEGSTPGAWLASFARPMPSVWSFPVLRGLAFSKPPC